MHILQMEEPKLEGNFHWLLPELGHALDAADLAFLRAVSGLDAKGERLNEPVAEKLLRLALHHLDRIAHRSRHAGHRTPRLAHFVLLANEIGLLWCDGALNTRFTQRHNPCISITFVLGAKMVRNRRVSAVHKTPCNSIHKDALECNGEWVLNVAIRLGWHCLRALNDETTRIDLGDSLTNVFAFIIRQDENVAQQPGVDIYTFCTGITIREVLLR